MKIFNIKSNTSKISWTLFALPLLLITQSCGEDFLEEDPPNILVADNLYVNFEGFQAGLNGLYNEVRKERMGSTGATENAAGDIRMSMMINGTDNVFGMNPGPSERITNEYGSRNVSDNGFIGRIFDWLYLTVNAANTIINRAENPDVEWSEEDKNKVIAEARTIRAWAYRHLTYLWGDVPLNLEESSGNTIRTDWTRATVSDIFTAMEADLLFAEEHLPDEPDNPGKVSKAVAQHYLAELYLRMGNAAEAEAKASAAIAGPFSLVTNRYGVRSGEAGVPFMDQFYDGNALRSQGNTEVLWAILQENLVDNPDQGKNIMRRYFQSSYWRIVSLSEDRGGRGIGRMNPTNWALSIYESQDDRISNFAVRQYFIYREDLNDNLPAGVNYGDTLFTNTVPETSIGSNNNIRALYPFTRKWDWADPINLAQNWQFGDQPYLRLADTYLLLAEAHLAQNELTEAAAAINEVRRRSNASDIAPSDVDIDFILDERSREFLCEGQRRYHLLRTGKLLERVQLHNPITGPVITERDLVFPIPQDVIDANLGTPMRQNDGY
ncbi:MAG: RagB/SusD family nutrient uptake outer membrane protein [Cyclobacteriaceae bacterium]|nr:RagB/SusD family nutrient uptake outer membrane protein [Cyclobacteriaceae bacterium HetDA_MAG_MS6]